MTQMRETGDHPSDDDREKVAEMLGRTPSGDYTVAVRDFDGSPLVLRNAPRLHNGTPMPTLYWLVGRRVVAAVGRIEATGAIDRVERDIGLERIAAIHEAYAAERDDTSATHDTEIPPLHGVGGTRRGVKCLHAHLAYWLAGGDDPVGRWTADRLTEAGVALPEVAR